MAITITLETRKTLAARARADWLVWFQDFPPDAILRNNPRVTVAGLRERVEAIRPDPDPHEVDEVMGHSGYTALAHCRGCGTGPIESPRRFKVTIESPSSGDFHLCEQCLRDFIETALVALPVRR